jgi:glycosyltransferase involved in cell wall biosynthesis
MNNPELTILMPALNEARTIALCIQKAKAFIDRERVDGEILVVDNGSSDDSQAIALRSGARVVCIEEKGYGNALFGGIQEAEGKYVIMGDADGSYNFSDLKSFVEKLREGFDLVMGNRFKGGIAPHAMPFLHRFFGNRVLSLIGKVFFRSPCNDIYCGLRGFDREKILQLDIRATGMEFAVEMLVKATINGLKITEVPTTLSPDGRDRPPHLRTWSDGWRTLRFLLLYSPTWLFFYPGIILITVGFVGGIALIFGGPLQIRHVFFDIHSLLLASLCCVAGFQAVSSAFISKYFAVTEKLLPVSSRFAMLFRYFNLEKGLLLGFFIAMAGLGVMGYAIILWEKKSFGELDPFQMMRVVIPATTLIAVGIQIVLTCFLLGIIGLKRR